MKALSSEYTGHTELLTEFSNNTEETLECRRDTSGILVQLKELDTSIMLVMWDTLLERIQKTSEALQKTGLALNTAVQLLKSLISFIKDMREQYDETTMMMMVEAMLVVTQHCPQEYFRINSYLPVIDSLVMGINLCLEAY